MTGWLIILGMLGCMRSTPVEAEADDTVSGAGAVSATRSVQVDIQPGHVDDPRESWLRGQLELGLARLPGVTPVWAGQPAPGLEPLTTPDRKATLTVAIEDGTAVAIWCLDGCETFTASADGEELETTADALLAPIALALGQTHQAGELDTAHTDYARLVVGRALAVYEGTRAREREGQADPIIQAVSMDPSLVVVQWMAARTDAVDAVTLLSFFARGQREHTEPVHAAGYAWALERAERLGNAAEVWKEVVRTAPGDPRFVIPAARVGLKANRPDVAAEALADQPPTRETVPLEVELADLEQRAGASEELLVAWQQVDPNAVEPVRRRIERQLESGDLEGAKRLVDDLRKRGAKGEALALERALDANLKEGRTALNDVGRQLAALDEELAALESSMDVLAGLQNRYQRERFGADREPCDPALLDLVGVARTLGETLRGRIEAVRGSEDELAVLLRSPDVEPIVVGESKAMVEATTRRVERLVGLYLGGRQVQEEDLESPSRRCEG